MLHSAGIFKPCIEGSGRNPVGLSNFDDRKRLAVNQVVCSIGSNLQNFLQFLNSQDLALKIAIVRNTHWIAVGMFGESAMHPLTNHERCGLGIMHLEG